jgi:hypothetical protein
MVTNQIDKMIYLVIDTIVHHWYKATPTRGHLEHCDSEILLSCLLQERPLLLQSHFLIAKGMTLQQAYFSVGFFLPVSVICKLRLLQNQDWKLSANWTFSLWYVPLIFRFTELTLIHKKIIVQSIYGNKFPLIGLMHDLSD